MTIYNVQPGIDIRKDEQALLDALPNGSVLFGKKRDGHILDDPTLFVLVKVDEHDWRVWDEKQNKYRRQFRVLAKSYDSLFLTHYPHELGLLIEVEEQGENQ